MLIAHGLVVFGVAILLLSSHNWMMCVLTCVCVCSCVRVWMEEEVSNKPAAPATTVTNRVAVAATESTVFELNRHFHLKLISACIRTLFAKRYASIWMDIHIYLHTQYKYVLFVFVFVFVNETKYKNTFNWSDLTNKKSPKEWNGRLKCTTIYQCVVLNINLKIGERSPFRNATENIQF